MMARWRQAELRVEGVRMPAGSPTDNRSLDVVCALNLGMASRSGRLGAGGEFALCLAHIVTARSVALF